MKPIIATIQNIRIVKFDEMNYQLQREEDVTIKGVTEKRWIDHGYSQTMRGCYHLILKKELLLEPSDLQCIQSHLEGIQRAEKRMGELIERTSENKSANRVQEMRETD